MKLKGNIRKCRFFFVCNLQERQQIKELSKRLNRTQSDAVRQAVRMVVHELRKDGQDQESDQIGEEKTKGGEK